MTKALVLSSWQDSKSPSLITEEYMGTDNVFGNPVRNFESRGVVNTTMELYPRGGGGSNAQSHLMLWRSGQETAVISVHMTLPLLIKTCE